jgi:hypothetical protein
MREALEVVLALVVACGAIAGLATGLAFRQAHHANRVAPSSPSEAPLRWLVSPSRPAQLHRRLRRATRMVIAATQPLTPSRRRRRSRRNRDSGVLDGAGRELIRRALAVDARLVACDRGGALWRRRQLPDLARDVYTFETSAARLASLSTDLRRHLDELGGVQSSDDDTELGLDALEAAIGELRRTPSAARLPGEAPPRRAG